MTTAIVILVLSMGAVWPSDRAAQRFISADSIHVYIGVLADDSLEGREVGEPGAWKAGNFIISEFRRYGLQPKGDDGSYRQAFEFIKKTDFGPNNRLTVNGTPLQVGVDFQPMPHSGNVTFNFPEIVDVGYGITSSDPGQDDYAGKDVKGKAVLFSRYSPEDEEADSVSEAADTVSHTDSVVTDPNAPNKRYGRYSALADKIVTAIDHGAAGVFLYTPSDRDDTLLDMGSTHVTPKDIPIIFLRRAGLQKLGLSIDSPRVMTASGTTDLARVRDTGYNVIGYLPGRTDTTIIIGAHYDHLGYGGPTSRYRGKVRMIHNGADDNASGVSALMETARYFAGRPDTLRHSLLFIAFSGEEEGLLGSSYFVRHWTVDSSKALMMINMDMVGRLATQPKGLAILGTGTCKEFKDYFDKADMGKLKVVFKEEGTGPSDHAAFYNDSIPCLAFFTGAHKDYHTPFDDVDKIDFAGVATVANLVVDIVEQFDDFHGRLSFQRTKASAPGGHMANLSVTLGIMPDYVSEVNGLGVDAVTPDRPADHAGILRGDVIIGMGGHKVGDIYDYMNALSKYRKGDSTPVTVVRGADTLSVMVRFK